MHQHVLIGEVELTDLLDRILEKSLFIDFGELLFLGQADLSLPGITIRVVLLELDMESYAVLAPSLPYQRIYRHG